MFREILDKAEKVVHIMEDVHNTNDLYIKGRHANFLRNDWMVENADMFLIWDPSSPGTADCFTSVKRARKAYIVMSQGIL